MKHFPLDSALRRPPAPSGGPDGLPVPQRYLSAAAIWLAIAMSVLDGAIANVALPTIARELHASAAVAVWVINAYQLAITVLLLPLAALGDRIGYTRVYVPGLILFIIGSGACALAPTLPALLAARVLQGIGAAGIMSMNAALVRATWPAALLGRGMGYNAMVLSASAAAGPTLAAAILSVAEWPWLFAINVPIGIAAVLLGRRSLPRVPGHGRRPDYLSALLSAAMLGLIVYGGETLAREGSASAGLLLAGGVVAGVLLWRRSRDRCAPLFPIDLLRIPVFRLSILTSIASFSAQMLAYVAVPFFLQQQLGRSVVETGLLMTPWPLAVGVVAPIAGRLADRHPAGLLGGIGLMVFAGGLASLALLPADPAWWDISWRMALCGAGFGLFQSPNNRAMISVAPRARSGAAGGMLATARLLGQTIGAVAVAAGFHWLGLKATPLLLGAAAGVALVAAGISLLRLRLPRER